MEPLDMAFRFASLLVVPLGAWVWAQERRQTKLETIVETLPKSLDKLTEKVGEVHTGMKVLTAGQEEHQRRLDRHETHLDRYTVTRVNTLP